MQKTTSSFLFSKVSRLDNFPPFSSSRYGLQMTPVSLLHYALRWRKHSLTIRFTDASSSTGLEFQTHLTGHGRPRPDLSNIIASTMRSDPASRGARKAHGHSHRTWVYISGPNGFIASGKKACEEEDMRARAGGEGGAVEVFAASWDP